MKQERDGMSIENFFKNLLTSYALIILATYVLVTFIAQPFTICGASMYPTLKSGDLVIVNKLPLRHADGIHAGDIVAFFAPKSGADVLIKRVSGSENGLQKRYFVIGDNAGHSIDSRQFGEIAEEKIIGKAVCILWPPGDFGPLRSPSRPKD